MKNLNTYIVEKYNTDSIEEYLESIVNSAKGKPDIWDDSESWDAEDDFEYWQDTFGQWDDILEFIDKYASNKCVAGWKSKDSFESVEKLVPNIVRNIIKKEPTEIPYKKNSNKMEVWETSQDGFNIRVLKFGNYVNDNGTDYKEYKKYKEVKIGLPKGYAVSKQNYANSVELYADFSIMNKKFDLKHDTCELGIFIYK